MSVCFNSVKITAPTATTEALLKKGFSLSEVDDWGLSPQNFSFAPFVSSTAPEDSSQEDSGEDKSGQDNNADELADIWTNWIEISNSEAGDLLTIEFESKDTPPLTAINAMTLWLKRENLAFDLEMKYRLENETWEGEYRDNY